MTEQDFDFLLLSLDVEDAFTTCGAPPEIAELASLLWTSHSSAVRTRFEAITQAAISEVTHKKRVYKVANYFGITVSPTTVVPHRHNYAHLMCSGVITGVYDRTSHTVVQRYLSMALSTFGERYNDSAYFEDPASWSTPEQIASFFHILDVWCAA